MKRLLVAAIMAAFPLPVLAQPACMPHDKMVSLLDSRHSEQPVAVGLTTNGRLIEILATEDGATWSMIMTSPAGASCIVAAGIEWQKPLAKAKGKGT